MSAFMVEGTHIDALVTAGLRWGSGRAMSWIWPAITPEDEGAFMPGEPWGAAYTRLVRERTHHLDLDAAGRVGAMLLAENRRSVNHRYDEDEIEEPYEFRPLRGDPDPVVVLKSIACYIYQACESPEWQTSEAREFCERLRIYAIDALPGYSDAPWSIADRDVFTAPATVRVL